MSDAPIPDDLLREIIALLPAKHAVQCKALSKGWFRTISDKKFVSQNYSNHAVHKKLVARSRHGSIYSVGDHNNRFVPSRIFPGRRFHKIGGTCDGLCLLADKWGDILILNPLMKNKSLVIPTSELDLPPHTGYIDYGIYKVEETGEYKVVVMSAWSIAVRRSPSFTHGVVLDVYSTKTNSWRRCPQNEFTSAPFIFHLASLVGSKVYFVSKTVVQGKRYERLISYDVERDSTQFVQTPHGLSNDRLRGAVIAGVDRKLCLLTGRGREQELWIVGIPRGGSDCWARIPLGDLRLGFRSQAIAMGRPNTVLFINDGGRLSIYDADDGSMALVVPIMPLNRVSEARFYSESMIDPTALP